MTEFPEILLNLPKNPIYSRSYLIPVARRLCTAHRVQHCRKRGRRATSSSSSRLRLVLCLSFCACVGGGGGGGGIVRIAVRVRVHCPRRRSESSLRTPKFHNTIKMKLKPITALLKTIKYHECSRTHFTHVILLRLRMIGNSG